MQARKLALAPQPDSQTFRASWNDRPCLPNPSLFPTQVMYVVKLTFSKDGVGSYAPGTQVNLLFTRCLEGERP